MSARRGDRHLRADPHGALADAPAQATAVVRVRIEPAYAQTVAGQHLMSLLVNLLCRQFGILAGVRLAMPPDVAALIALPFGCGDTFTDQLISAARLIARQEIAVALADDAEPVDFEIHVGPTAQTGHARHYLSAYGLGWRFAVSSQTIPLASGDNADSPVAIGPYLAASLAAGEVFKRVRGMRVGGFIERVLGSAWTMSTADAWGLLEDGPAAIPLIQSHIYFAGCGAVAQAAAWTMTASGAHGQASAIDYDALDETNENRYVLTHADPPERDKATVLASHLRANGITCHEHSRTWGAHAQLRGGRTLDPAVASAERRLRFPIVLSCVDKNAARHEIQAYTPELLLGASTDGLSAKASIFDLSYPPHACLACHNPPERRNHMIEEQLSQLRPMTPEQRQAFALERGIDPTLVERMLNPTGCGELSAQELELFSSPAPQMSVGFVSAGAGALLCAQLFRAAALGPRATSDGDQVILSFRNGRLKTLHTAQDSQCTHHAALHHQWMKTWRRGANAAG